MRSAEARASAEGTSIEDILAAWAGGAPPPAPAEEEPAPAAEEPAPEPDAAEEEVEPSAPRAEPTPTPEPVVSVTTPPDAAVPTVAATKTVPIFEMPAPILEGQRARPGLVLIGALALFLFGVLGSVILPAFAAETERIVVLVSESAEAGRTVYLQEGCFYCHTQLVRPIVTDVNLGPVTEASDLGSAFPSTVGVMRLGPDLAHVGSRPIADDAFSLSQLLLGEGGFSHPSYRYLPESDLTALVAYLESLD